MKKHTSIILINLISLTFFILFNQSFSVDRSYELCAPKDCGDGHIISYPFYIKGLQDNTCGVSGFELLCNANGSATIQISENNYTIDNIQYKSKTFRVKNTKFLSSLSCMSPLIENVTSDLSFVIENYDSKNKLLLLSKCSRNISSSFDRYKIRSCDDEYVMLNNDVNFDNVSRNCGHIVETPMDGDTVVDGGNYADVVERGFVIRWLAEDCGHCRKSGGRCGVNTTNLQFRCFCTDRPHKVRCLHDTSNTNIRLILGVLGVGGVGAVTISIFIILCRKLKYGWRKKVKYNINAEMFLKNHEFLAPNRYSYSEIKKMTNSFQDKLGQGGFGSVYKGILNNQSLVAVKVLSELKGNGEDFINEVASVGRTSHVNIVSLVGFCLEGHQRALIYEFMPNGSLEKFIYGRSSSHCSQLGWEKLHGIAIGIARGLEYLHRGCNTRILHFDIKPHNILLDQEFCPKISDFGLAKLFPEKMSMISMSNMRGTPGYIAPEVFSRCFGGVSHKSDVYSYGMMILEMVGGRRNIEVEVDHTSEIYFPHWIYKKVELQEEQLGLHEIVNDEENEMARKMIIVGLWCIQTNPSSRPTITKVLEMLEGGLELLDIPPKPYMVSPSRSPSRSQAGSVDSSVTH